MGLAICKDTGVAAHAARTAALGIDVYAAGVLEAARDAAVTDQRAHRIATAHGVWVAVASFAGSTGGGYTEAAGRSGIWTPDGEVFARGGTEPGESVRASIGERCRRTLRRSAHEHCPLPTVRGHPGSTRRRRAAVVLPVVGVARAAGSDDGWSAFLLGGVLFALYPLPELAAEAAPGVPAPAGGWSGVTLACNVDSRDEVDTAFAAAVAAGATVVAEPTDRSWGGRSGYIADPEGNRWEIAWAGTPASTSAALLLLRLSVVFAR